jgi:uncharacterized membrane protein
VNTVNLIIVIFIYIFAFAMSLFMVGTIAERMHIKRRMSSRPAAILIVLVAVIIYVACLFLFLNDWAREMVYSTSRF